MNTPKPLKRSTQLAPLSREHHEGLLFVWKIREGLKNDVRLSVIAEFVHWFWKHHLEEHFKQEELLLTPHVPSGNQLIEQMLSDHRNIRDMIMRENLDEEAVLGQIAGMINDHIRFEERILFPFLENEISSFNLEIIYRSLQEEKKVCPAWDNPFWLKK